MKFQAKALKVSERQISSFDTKFPSSIPNSIREIIRHDKRGNERLKAKYTFRASRMLNGVQPRRRYLDISKRKRNLAARRELPAYNCIASINIANNIIRNDPRLPFASRRRKYEQ